MILNWTSNPKRATRFSHDMVAKWFWEQHRGKFLEGTEAYIYKGFVTCACTDVNLYLRLEGQGPVTGVINTFDSVG